MMDGVGGLLETEYVQVLPVRVGQKGPTSAEPREKRRGDGGRIDADRDEPRVRHLRFVLQSHQLPEKCLLLGAPEAAIELDQERIAASKIRQAAQIAPVIGKLQVQEGRASGRSRINHAVNSPNSGLPGCSLGGGATRRPAQGM